MIDEKRLAELKKECVPIEMDDVFDTCDALLRENAALRHLIFTKEVRLSMLATVARTAEEVHRRYIDPYTTSIRTHAAILEMAKALLALKEKP